MTFTSGGPYAIIESTVRIATTDVSSTCCTIDGTLKNRPVSCIPTGSYATAKTENGTLTVTFANDNTGTEDRTALVTITDDCGNTGYFTVVQKGKAAASTACQLELKSIQADRSSADKYTDIVEYTANASTTAYAVKGICCTTNGPYTYEVISGAGELTTPSNGTNTNTTGKFTVTYNTENPGTAPRVTVIKVKDNCDNIAYFIAVQKAKPACQLVLKTTNDPSSADKYTDIVENTANASTTVNAIKGDCCPTSGYTYEKISGDGVLNTTGNNTGAFTVTYKTENTDPAPRVTVIRVKDACGNYAYFTAVQKAKPACQLELKSIQADRSSADKYTDIVEYTANASTTAYAVKGDCCPTNGYTYEVIWGDGVLTNPTSGNNTTGRFTVTYNTENTDPAPRVTVIKVKDPCGNFAYFIAVQEGKACALELKSIQADRSSADKYTDIVENTAGANTTAYAIKGDCCPTNGYTYEVISGAGELTNPTNGNNTTGRFTVTYKTENTDPAPRVTVIKVKDACDNYAYFTAVQKGKAETGTSFAAVGSFTPGPGVQQSGIGTPALDTFWGKIMPGGKYRVYIHTTATSWNAGTYYIYLQVRTQPGTDVWAEQRFQLKHRNFTPSSSITYTSPGTGNDMGQSSQASIGDAIGLGLLDSYVNFNGTPATGKGYAEFDTEGKDWKNGGDDGAIRIQTWSGTHRIDGFVRWE